MKYRTPTHYEALLRALHDAGGRLTYGDLERIYGEAYNAQGFAQAVRRAKGLGLVRREGAWIVACGCCPMCGRPLNTNEVQ